MLATGNARDYVHFMTDETFERDIAALGRDYSARREKLGLSIYRVSKETGVRAHHIALFEAGERPNMNLQTLHRLATRVGMKVTFTLKKRTEK